MLNHQTDVQICSQGAWDNHESAPVVILNCSPDHNSRRRSSVSRPQTDWLHALTWPPSNQYTAITGTQAEPAFIVANGSGLESVECTLQGVWLEAVLEVTDL
ncbi:hypothetical protein AVEN_230087-1 [Araneus ventricosus]|uniref:Uncharacterized protein n=1 Tax=Araneus ventricosus TaxID=182803 RepID=A0A4Y2H3T1_ARAVE|nr:hypothetical protein AVEN_230087-1 [Araneus ventricosus]